MRWLLSCVFCVFGAVGCGTTNYRFPTERAQQCFTPCKSMYYGCRAQCDASDHYPHHHRRADGVDAVLGLVGIAVDLGCERGCSLELDRCAASCGATNVNHPRPVSSAPPSRPSRNLALSGAVRQDVIESQGGVARAETHCRALWARIEHLARDTPRAELPASCEGEGDLVATCKRLLPAVAQCLLPEVMRRAPDRCRRWMQREDPQIAAAMNSTLRGCYERTDWWSRSAPTSQPGPAVGPQEDAEAPD